jgi:hypothetical protein
MQTACFPFLAAGGFFEILLDFPKFYPPGELKMGRAI